MSVKFQTARETLTLAEARPGYAYTIASIVLPGPLGDRLLELGLTRRAPVTLLRRAPLGGPLQVRIRDFVLTLRAEHARAIELVAAPAAPTVTSTLRMATLQPTAR